MRLFFILLITSSSYFLIGQTAWEQLMPNNSEDVEIIYSDETLMMGQMQYPSKLLVSQDFGENWTEISTISKQRRIPLVRKQFNGGYLILLDEEVLSWSIGDNNFTDILDLGEGNWTTVAPLPNGNFMVTGISEFLSLYSASGSLLKILTTGRIQEIITTSGDEHYFFQGNPFGNMVTINSDLEVLKEGESGLYVSDHFKYDGSRFYNSRFYSDNGDDWLPYGNDLFGVVTFLNNGDIHLIADCAYSNTSSFCDEVYISSDRGETFQYEGELGLEFTLPSAGYINFRNDTYLGTQAIGPNGVVVYDAGNNYYSADGRTNWILRGQEVGQAFAFDVEAASKEGLIIRADDFKNKTSDAGDWAEILATDTCTQLRGLQSLPNGEYITTQGCKSSDGGINWSGDNLGTWSVYIKEGVVYGIGGSKIFISNNNGNAWTENTLPMQSGGWEFFIETGVYDFSSTGYFYADQYIPGVGPAKYNLQGDLLLPIAFNNENLRDLRTSYEGSTVYALTANGNSNYKFYVSSDDAVTFVERDLPSAFLDSRLSMEVDHEGRVYLYSSSEIWKSMDDGASWVDLSPTMLPAVPISDFDVSWDGYAFAATEGLGVIRSVLPICSQETTSSSVLFFNALSFYPNPVKNRLNINIDNSESYVDFLVMDMLGKQLNQIQVKKGQSEYGVDVSSFEPGSYLLSIRGKDGINEVRKFIVAY